MSDNASNPEVFSYEDYRVFMKDVCADRKRRGLSQRGLARRAGLGSPSFLKAVMDGQKNLAPATAKRVALALGLTGDAAEYFRWLVAHGQTVDAIERRTIRANLGRLRRYQDVHALAEDRDSYHRRWYLYDDRVRGLPDDAGYRRQLARVRTQRSDAAKKVETANAELDDEWLFTAQRTLELAKSAAELWVSRSGAEKRALLEMMLSNPTLTGRKVAYELKKPFAVLAETRRKGVGRAP